MKITDDMLTEWRKEFEAEFPMPPDCIWTGKGYSQTRYDAWRAQEYAHMWNGFVAGRRTTPDRDAIIEECARACERVAEGRSVVEMNVGAKLCADAVRALKTTPTTASTEES
ncbi:hypothetical protein L0Z13_11805 [Burkholderia multivorans]|uniref:hypothetical protein n=1 Tax=Burkholderia multivorans TaxID=87883 RepID=UPI0009E0DDB5|nr:hypothetical protein [Burkholderia multivorans]MCO1435411.1 hypothetical protein [Burkholderia multivorans]UQN59210.1 hypothetical protein L0Y94_21650 [Burkholderia multivorans]UQN67474.1 hypothetical protein L0Y92_19705 [Burkholderia multivorans]UQO04967.1 hypothetical protein L0Z13_11480 [Burkholderia multivorans]UQO05025.1 hypothetical protein L0Z13_11805 [Burkholderia multivorans]